MPDTPLNFDSVKALGKIASLERVVNRAVREVITKKLNPLAGDGEVGRPCLDHILSHEEEIVVIVTDAMRDKIDELMKGAPTPTSRPILVETRLT